MATNTEDSGNNSYDSERKISGPRGKENVIDDLAEIIGLRRYELIEYARIAAERADLEDEEKFSLTDYREVLEEEKRDYVSSEAIKSVLSSSAQLSDNFGGMYHHGESPDSIYFSYEGDSSYRGEI